MGSNKLREVSRQKVKNQPSCAPAPVRHADGVSAAELQAAASAQTEISAHQVRRRNAVTVTVAAHAKQVVYY